MRSTTEEFLKSYQDNTLRNINLPESIQQDYAVISCLKDNASEKTYLLLSISECKKYIIKITESNQFDTVEQEYIISEQLNQKSKEMHVRFPYAYRFFKEGTQSCFIRDYIEGTTLREYVSSKTTDCLSEPELIKCALDLCDALLLLHHNQPPIIHRDIKPDNVIVDKGQNFCLIDFGISRYYQEDGNNDTVIIGTNQTAAPEQFGFCQTDTRSDIYSLGVLLCFAATCEYKPEKLQYASISKTLKRIIRKCMEFSPSSRYQTIEELKKELLRITPSKTLTWPIRHVSLRIAAIILLSTGFLFGILFHQYLSGYLTDYILTKGADIMTVVKPVDPEDEYVFTEPLIEKAVRQYLDKDEDEIITNADLSLITFLGIYGNQPFDSFDQVLANGFNPFINVEAYRNSGLCEQNGGITSLKDLLSMPNLRELAFYNQKVSDLSDLSELNLNKLALGTCPVIDITPIATQKGLTSLILSSCVCIGTLSPVAELENLRELNLTDTNIADLSPLYSLSHLDKFTFNNRFAEMYTVARKTGAKQLVIWNMTSNDLSVLSDLPDLEDVQCYGNGQALEPALIANSTNLKKLTLLNFQIYQFTALTQLTALETLSINGATLNDLVDLEKLTSLKELICNKVQSDKIEESKIEYGFTLTVY